MSAAFMNRSAVVSSPRNGAHAAFTGLLCIRLITFSSLRRVPDGRCLFSGIYP